MSLFFYFSVFIFGLAIGSFLNVVIFRLKKGESFLLGRSYCPHCRHKLSWQDLIPLFSFIFLSGKCRYCRKKISWQYPLVEISTALIFFLISNFQFPISKQFPIFNYQTLIPFFYYLVIASILIVIFVYDLKDYIIPDGAVFLAMGVIFLYRLFEVLNLKFYLEFGFWNLDFKNLTNPLLAALGASAFFLLIFLISKGNWMGFGDVKLAALMGFFLGYPNILVALFLAFSIGAIMGVGMIFAGKKRLSSEIPFGPFLVLGTFIALFWGQSIINWYLNFLII